MFGDVEVGKGFFILLCILWGAGKLMEGLPGRSLEEVLDARLQRADQGDSE